MSHQKVEFMGKREPRNARHKMVDVLPLKAPYAVNLNPCGICNFHCAFCPANSKTLKPEFQKHMDEIRGFMPMDLFYKIADGFLELEEQTKVIYLTMTGEPLLHPQIAEMVDYLKRKKVCRDVRIISNGSLLNPQLNQDLINAGLDVMKVSVEALSAEGYQRLCNVHIDYDRFLDNIKDYYQRCEGTDSTIVAKILTVSLKDQEEFNRFYQIYEPITHYQEVRNVENIWPGFSFEIKDEPVHVEVEQSEVGYDGICPAAFIELGINVDGSVGLCKKDWAGQLCLGNVHEMSIREIWDSEKRRQYHLQHLQGRSETNPFCKICRRSHFGDSISPEDAKIILKRMN